MAKEPDQPATRDTDQDTAHRFILWTLTIALIENGVLNPDLYMHIAGQAKDQLSREGKRRAAGIFNDYHAKLFGDLVRRGKITVESNRTN